LELAADAGNSVDAASTPDYAAFHQLMDAGLELQFVPQNGVTSFRCVRQEPPWKVVRGFTLETGGSLVHLNNVSGGVFGGDHLKMSARLAPDAEAQITTTGATRVYRPRPQANEATLFSSFELGCNAFLEYLPDALIPFREACVFQRTAFSLADGATLFAWDTIAPGRTAAGEIFQYQRLKLVSEIKVAGEAVLNDRLLLEPQRWPPSSAAVFGRARYLVTFLAVRAGTTAAQLKELEECLEFVAHEAEERNAFWGVTTLPSHGVMVRGMTDSPLGIQGMLGKFWSAAKGLLCHREAIAPRKLY
jgi:urease accessory protein